jgi:hypothetical protein
MKLKFQKASVCLFLSTLAFSQVGISKGENSNFLAHPNASLHVLGDQEEGINKLGFILPSVDEKSQLPLINNTEDGYADDPTMEGMILYGKENKSVNVYTGQIWEDDKNRFVDPKLKQARFLSKGDGSEQQSIVCVLLVCGRDKYLQFSHDVDDVDSYDNLGITRETIEIRYSLVEINTFPNSKFIVSQPGTYQIQVNIPTYIAGVVSLTEGASYQIYAYKKKSDNPDDFEEILLSSVVPNFPGVLGIGGGGKVGVGINATISLNAGDYIYTMIHTPSVTVAVGSELRSWDKGLFNPREIIFTKLD